MRQILWLILVVTLGLGSGASAAEYFVSLRGDDAANGTSAETALATIAKGVTLLKPGDTLTIGPGTYFEAIAAPISGTPQAPVTIRAARPGTVLVRGDRDVNGFTCASGYRYTHVAPFKPRVEGVVERDVRFVYSPKQSVDEVEDTLGSFYQDESAGLLYIHTSDSLPPAHHAIAVSITNGFGLHLQPPRGTETVRDVIVDGLAFTGFHSRDFPTGPGRNRWGLFAQSPERVTVRRCVSYLNSGGIFLVNARGCVVEDCYAFANFSRSLDFGNNILGWGAVDTIFRRNVVEGFGQGASSTSDITFYSGSNRSVMEDNLAINAGLMIKGGMDEMPKADLPAQNRNRVLGSIGYFYWEPNESNLLLKEYVTPATIAQYADPFNHDFRLQGGTPDQAQVFYVSPGGDDGATGTSLKSAWRTLAAAGQRARPGQTVYVTEGVYHEPLIAANSGTSEQPIRFARYGHDRVVIDGQQKLSTGIDISDRANVIVVGLVVRGQTESAVRADRTANVRLERLTLLDAGVGVSASGAQGLQMTHCLVRGHRVAGVGLKACTNVTLLGNLLDENRGPTLSLDEATRGALVSNWNNFVPCEQALAEVESKKAASLNDWRALSQGDGDSIDAKPEYRDGGRGDFTLAPQTPLAGRGPQGATIGPYRRVNVAAPTQIEQLGTFTVTATTANLEWWTPRAPTACTVDVTAGQSPKERYESPAGLVHRVSLVGLPAGCKVEAEVRAANSSEYFWAASALKDKESVEPSRLKLSFTSLQQDAAPRVLHVAKNGDDRSDGLTLEKPLRTISQAARLAVAGDTVMIHAGEYDETITIRSTGDRLTPVTFRAAPGEVVWLDSDNRTRSVAFNLQGKHHIRIDGLRFRSFNFVPHADAVINIRGGSNHTITRCLADGRVFNGYSGCLVRAENSDSLLIENCVALGNMAEAFVMSRVRRATIRHCVFYNLNIRALTNFSWNPDFRLELSHNLFCDVIPSKVNNALLRVYHLENLASDHNGFFTRVGSEQRRLVEPLNVKNQPVSQTLLLEEVRAAGLERHSLFGNPGFGATGELLPAKVPEIQWRKSEVRQVDRNFGPFDFADFFVDPGAAMSSAADGRPIGLDRAAFEKRD